MFTEFYFSVNFTKKNLVNVYRTFYAQWREKEMWGVKRETFLQDNKLTSI
jgi:hypothetical protein